MIEGMFFALTLTAACIAALLTYRMGLKEGAIRERRRRDYEVLRLSMARIHGDELTAHVMRQIEAQAREDRELWETEIDA